MPGTVGPSLTALDNTHCCAVRMRRHLDSTAKLSALTKWPGPRVPLSTLALLSDWKLQACPNTLTGLLVVCRAS
jgi:hypothetical protein